MSRTQLFFYNSISTAILQVITFISGFIIPKCMLIYYGSEINGLISSILQFIAYFNLVEAGISGAAVYALYKPLASNDQKNISAVVSAAKKFYIQSGYIFVLLTLLLALLYPFYITTSVLSKFEIFALVLILGVNGCLEFFTLAKYRALLTADQRTYVIAITSMIYVILNTIVVVMLSNLKLNIVYLRLWVMLTIFIRTYLLMLYCKYKYPYINYREEFNPKVLSKRWDALFLQFLGVVHVGAPVVIITLILRDLKLVSIYAIYNMILGGISGILGIFISGLAASFGDVIIREQKEILQKTYKEFECFYYALITVAYSVTFLTIMPFIELYTRGITDADYSIPILGVLFTFNALLYCIKTPQGMLVISAGLYKETRLQTLTQALIMIIGGIILAPYFGIIGVLLACIASNLYRDIDLLFYIPHTLTSLPVSDSAFRIMLIFVNISIIVLPFYFLPKILLSSYWTWGMYALGTTIYASVVVLCSLIVFEKKELAGLTKRIKIIIGV